MMMVVVVRVDLLNGATESLVKIPVVLIRLHITQSCRLIVGRNSTARNVARIADSPEHSTDH
jgi:hypothetical protein